MTEVTIIEQIAAPPAEREAGAAPPARIYLDLSFPRRNWFKDEEVAVGIAAATKIFADAGLTASEARQRVMQDEGLLWAEAELAAVRAMCAAAECPIGAAENASLKLVDALAAQ